MSKKTTEYDHWQEIGNQAKRLGAEKNHLHSLLTGDVPKTVWKDQFGRLDDSYSKLKSDLEDRIADEHPSEWEISDFYGDADVTAVRESGIQLREDTYTCSSCLTSFRVTENTAVARCPGCEDLVPLDEDAAELIADGELSRRYGAAESTDE